MLTTLVSFAERVATEVLFFHSDHQSQNFLDPLRHGSSSPFMPAGLPYLIPDFVVFPIAAGVRYGTWVGFPPGLGHLLREGQ